MKTFTSCAIAMAITACAATHALAAPAPQTLSLGGSGGSNYNFRVYSSRNLLTTGSTNDIERAVIVQHGAGRNGDVYYDHALTTLSAKGNPQNTLLLAPQFYNEQDAQRTNFPYWIGGDWLSGLRTSKNSVAPNINSFQVLDDLLFYLNNTTKFPKLKTIILVGHSGGGQMYQRYSVFSNSPVFGSKTVQFAIGNAGTYLYFDKARPTNEPVDGAPSADAFSSFKRSWEVPGFNTYKYGLDGLSDVDSKFTYPYPGTDTGISLFSRVANRRVTYFLGTADTVVDGELDTSDEANISGTYRLARGRTHFRHELHYADKNGLRATLTQNHKVQLVNGVGHNDQLMWASRCASQLIFGTPASNTSGASCTALAQ